jgi:hypothetical protein
VQKKTGFVIARSEATKQSRVPDEKIEIASLPPVARNDINLFLYVAKWRTAKTIRFRSTPSGGWETVLLKKKNAAHATASGVPGGN